MRTLVVLILLGLGGFLAYRLVGGGSDSPLGPGGPGRPGPALPSLESAPVALPPAAKSTGTFELCLWIEGRCELEVNAAGIGTGRVLLEDESGARTELCALKLNDQVEVRRIAMEPGPLRPVRLFFIAPKAFRWRELRMLVEPHAPGTGALSRPGALAGHDVFVILFDALYAERLGAWGNERPTSATLDRLSSEGVRFARAYSQTAWTLPSVVSLFTSLEQESHGVRWGGLRLGSQFSTLGESLVAGGYQGVALVQNGVADRESDFARGLERFETYKHPLADLDRLLDDFVATVEQGTQDGSPLFVYAHLLPPHGPYLYPGGGRTDFDPDYKGPVDGSMQTFLPLVEQQLGPEHPDVVHLRALYDEYIRYVDRRVGETLERLERASDRPTLFVLLSDHGESFGEHGVLGHEHQIFEEMVHVPLILCTSDDSLPRGLVVDEPVSLLDVYPTLVELLGLPKPEGPLRGRSLVPLLCEGQLGERPLFLSARYRKGEQAAEPQLGVSFAGFKLVHTLRRGTERFELFDLTADPGETRDVSREHPVRTDAMKALLRDWLVAGDPQTADETGGELTEAMLEELRKLGYVGEEDD